MTIDLSEVAAQVRGFFNSGATTGYRLRAGRLQVPHLADRLSDQRRQLPLAEGDRSPPGTVVSAVRPAAMRWWMTFPMTVVDTIFKAMEQAIPERTIAGHHADLRGRAASTASRRRTGGFFIAGIGPLGRRLGRQAQRGRHERHGLPERRRHAQQPVRADRGEVPGAVRAPRAARGLRRRRDAIAAASAPSRWSRRARRCTVNMQVDRVHCPPWGLAGGERGHGQPGGAAHRRQGNRPTCPTPRCSRAD